ncbi:hypothetical protein H310_09056 [Aphanomyces invadans]|uniref:Uncharacterized protein n=1 Tax=Aphanomyces invadans TaxID=157072 RepID=A0A024TXL6_9STRA|nr:hypothetical protein H310_09056 [Aphanomyces invadans]ETV98366.1 hypothetical protein H310_09056 [Aphanomyces invadans]|eukprot:XP_008873241.1 hypothetical protein H310_09056 [Aphanomyces invadans]
MEAIFRHTKKNPRFKARSKYVKPHLAPANIQERLKFALPFIRPLLGGRHLFTDMNDYYVHVDAKWYYRTKVERRYYVYDDQTLGSKNRPKGAMATTPQTVDAPLV